MISPETHVALNANRPRWRDMIHVPGEGLVRLAFVVHRQPTRNEPKFLASAQLQRGFLPERLLVSSSGARFWGQIFIGDEPMMTERFQAIPPGVVIRVELEWQPPPRYIVTLLEYAAWLHARDPSQRRPPETFPHFNMTMLGRVII
jgi:hypothetical protein